MKVIGLTGPTGAGKGSLGVVFQKYDIPVIDADKVYHDLLSGPSPCRKEIVSFFGRGILNEDRTINRKDLAQIVFADKSGITLKQLNRITHRHVIRATKLLLRKYGDEGKKAAVMDAPLLFESGFDKRCDFVIAVLADKDLRLKRIMARDGITAERAMDRMRSQKDDCFYRIKARYTIRNDNDLDESASELEEILKKENII